MKFQNLTVNNYGVFRGEHVFELNSTISDKRYRNLTLFSGHNGAGKSTLFQAIKLALYGRFALGDRISQQEYNDYLLNRLHRCKNGSHQEISDSGGIKLSLEYVQSGSILIVKIDRQWRKVGSTVSEKLSIELNGQPPEAREEDYQFWLNELFSPELAPIIFYDAEHLNALSDPSNQAKELSNLVSRLSGMNLIERLHNDLDYYLHRQQGGQKTDRLREKVLQFQETLDDLDNNRKQLQEDSEYWSNKQSDLEKTLSRTEQSLISEGGSYAARRPMLKERLSAAEKEIEAISNQLRELSAQLLPFSLTPNLCQMLSQRLAFENDLLRQKIASELWQSKIENLEKSSLSDDVWQGIRASKKTRQNFIRRIMGIVEANGLGEEEHILIHYLAEPDHEKLQNWIVQSLYSVPLQVKFLGKRLKNFRAEQQQIKVELNRAPENEALLALYKEIEKLELGLDTVKDEQKSIQGQIGALKYQREDIFRQFQQACDELRSAQANQLQMDLAERSRLVLQTYQDALARQRVGSLEKAVVECFNTICHKDHLLESVEIDPESYEIILRAVVGQNLRLLDFSAGENQLFAMALLRAIRQINQHKLPLIVDTPLARLDDTHRDRLIRNYFPTISDQVILFATDAEMGEELIDNAKPFFARVYRIVFDKKIQASAVELDSEIFLIKE